MVNRRKFVKILTGMVLFSSILQEKRDDEITTVIFYQDRKIYYLLTDKGRKKIEYKDIPNPVRFYSIWDDKPDKWYNGAIYEWVHCEWQGDILKLSNPKNNGW